MKSMKFSFEKSVEVPFEVFPDAVALLRWRDRNQRMLPKLALDGIATRDSCEQLIHCLQSGDKDGS